MTNGEPIEGYLRADAAADARRIAELKANLVAATRRLAQANQAGEPYRPALTAAYNAVQTAREHWWAANSRERQASKGRHRRAAHRDVEHTKQDLDAALAQQQQVEDPTWAALAGVLPASPTINIAHPPLTRPHTRERDIGIGIA